MKNVVIRPVRPDEEEIFIEIALGLSMFNRANRDCGPFELHMAEADKRNREVFRSTDEKQLLLFAEVEGKVLAYSICNYSEKRGKLVGYIDELFVQEEARGLGLGRKLMYACIDWMKEHEVTKVTLAAFSFNEKALEFYAKEGFNVYAVSLEKNI